MATYAKYLETFIKRHEDELNHEKENKHYITDPHSYISFLELQVEKSSKAVFLTDALAEKIDMMQAQINTLNEKIGNTNKLYQIFESSKEAQVFFFHISYFLFYLRKRIIGKPKKNV